MNNIMKPTMQTLVETVKENALKLKPDGGLSRGTLLKLGYEHWESSTGKSPSDKDKEQIREAIQKDLNTLGFRQDYELVISNKPFKRLTTGGELIVGRNTRFVDTRQMNIERQVKEIWSLIGAHQDKKARQPLYTGTDAERNKTAHLRRQIEARLYQLDRENELRVRVEAQMVKWFPPQTTPAAQALTNMTSPAAVPQGALVAPEDHQLVEA
jgi:hypothetical protein